MKYQINVLISLFTLGILVGTPSFANVLNTKFSGDQIPIICEDVEFCDNILKSVPQAEQMDLHGICEYLLNKSHTATLELIDIASSLVNKTSDVSIKKGYSVCLSDYQDQSKADVEDIARDFKSGNLASMVNRARDSIRKVRTCVEYDFEYVEIPVDPLLQQKVDGVANIYYVMANVADELIREKESGGKEHENKNDHGGRNVLNMKISKVQKSKMCFFIKGCNRFLRTIPEQKDLRGICEYLVNKTSATTMELNNIAASLVSKTEDKEMKNNYSTCLEYFAKQKGFDQKIAKDFKSGNFKGVYEHASEGLDYAVDHCDVSDLKDMDMKVDPLFLEKLDEADKMYNLIANISEELNQETKGSDNVDVSAPSPSPAS